MTTDNRESPVQAEAVGSNRWYLSAAPILRALVHLCAPMAAAMIVGAVYNLINAGFIGSLHDPTLLAAITFGAPLLGLVMGVGGVFGVGGGALISRLLGAAEHEPAKAEEIRRVSSFAVWGSVIAGAVFGGIGLLLLHPLVSVLGADAAAVPATGAFVAVMLAFVPVLAAAFCLEQLVRAEGAARQVMVGLIASTIGNVVFDVLFILVLKWGVAGAALSMGLQVLAAFVADRAVLAIGVTILTAQLVAMIVNGFTGLLTSLFQATGRALPATVMSVTQGVLFIPIVILGNLWFGLGGIIWALTVTEVTVFLVGVVLWLASRRAIDRGLAEGSPERADDMLEQAEA